MKYHYFNQNCPDADDAVLLAAIRAEQVPAGCLLGGYIVGKALKAGVKPCAGCNGPRARCGGSPKESSLDSASAAERKRLHAMFTGAGADPLGFLKRKG